MKHLLRLGNLEVGKVPLVVGVISSDRTLDHLLDAPKQPFDVAEFRMDLIGVDTPGWLDKVHKLHHAGYPTILTIRHPSEGGHWYREETERLAVYHHSLPYVGAVDAEISNTIFPTLAREAKAASRLAIGSFHDFHATPDDATLECVIEEGISHGADIVKIATFIQSEEDAVRLSTLLTKHRDVPLCLLGMGPLGAETRVSLPLAGSCLTYGFVDQVSAPGQLSSAKLKERLMADSKAYLEYEMTRRTNG